MTALQKIAFSLFLLLVLQGCGSNKNDQVNPDLTIPDVPPSDRGTRSPLDAK